MLGSDNPVIEYGNDVEGTAFCSADANDPLGSSSWNLQASQHDVYYCNSIWSPA